MRFTKPAIEALKKRADRYEVWEDGKTGLGLRIAPSGRKTWVLMYRFEGRPRRMTLGTYPRVGLATAHTKAGKAREALELGNDPGTENVALRRAERQAETVGELADEYVKRHASTKKTGDNDKWMIDREIRPLWGKRKAKTITRRDVIVLLDGIEDRGTPVMRNRTAGLMSKMFKFGVERGLLEASPCIGIRRLPETPRERVLTAAEIKSLWNGLDSADMAPVSRVALRFLLATGQRRAEVAGARRDEINGDVWEIPASRTKNGKPHTVPLSPLAKALLADIDALRVTEAEWHKAGLSVWLFPSPLEGTSNTKGGIHGHIMPSSLSRALSNNRARLGLTDPPPTPHDFRRTAASTMTALGISQFVVGKVLNHTEPGVTAKVYDRNTYLPDKTRALEVWGQWIEDVATGRQLAPNVITMRPAP